MKNSITLFIFSLLLFSIGCGNDDPTDAGNCSTDFAQSFEDELQAVSNASQAYGSDPSTANCEAFKAAYIDYLDALDGWEECANFYNQVTEWEQAIDAARMAADNIVC